jgi:hypothetical protein
VVTAAAGEGNCSALRSSSRVAHGVTEEHNCGAFCACEGAPVLQNNAATAQDNSCMGSLAMACMQCAVVEEVSDEHYIGHFCTSSVFWPSMTCCCKHYRIGTNQCLWLHVSAHFGCCEAYPYVQLL